MLAVSYQLMQYENDGFNYNKLFGDMGVFVSYQLIK